MNIASPFVSILVPIYGVEKYIERCARSLFEQTYPNLEFVFVDDASLDKSVEILERVITNYPKWEGRITIIHHDKNRGLAAARNTLVDNCKGEFLYHVDSDDWIEPNAVELLVKRQMETGADIVSGSFYMHRTNEICVGYLNWSIPWKERNREETLKYVLEMGSVVAVWNRLIRSSIYREHNIRCVEGIDAGEDRQITPMLVYFSREVASCNAITYHYNRSNANSYVSTFEHNWNLQLQLIRACFLNVCFFKDKETSLSEAMDKQIVKRLEKILELTFKNHNRNGYNMVLAMLDGTNREHWSMIRWDRPRKRWLDHHYYVKRMLLFLSFLHGERQVVN